MKDKEKIFFKIKPNKWRSNYNKKKVLNGERKSKKKSLENQEYIEDQNQ